MENFKTDFAWKFIGLAFLSGVVTSLVYEFLDDSIIFWGFGTIYGLFTLIALVGKYGRGSQNFFWLFGTTLSFVLAVFIAIKVITASEWDIMI